MNESDEKIKENSTEIFQLEKLSDKQLFSFLKRYYTDDYQLLKNQKPKMAKGVFRETILTLESLFNCLVKIDDFIGYDQIDWQDACQSTSKYKKKKIVDFYNNLAVNWELIKWANQYYVLHPKIEAFIKFLDEENICIFRIDGNQTVWGIDSFPDKQVFPVVSRFRCFLKNFKTGKLQYDPDEIIKAGKDIYRAIKPVAQITQMLFVLKINLLDLSKKEIQELIENNAIDEYIVDYNRSEKLQVLVELVQYQQFGKDLPWICTLTKAELEHDNEIRLLIGFIFDSSKQTLSREIVIEKLQRNLDNILRGSLLNPFINFQLVLVDQIFDHLGVGTIKKIKLQNDKKVRSMMKWYLGVFYEVDRIIKPDNHTLESGEFNEQSYLQTNRGYLDSLEQEQERSSAFWNNLSKSSPMQKEYDYHSIWGEKSLLKQAPKYARSAHEFYCELQSVEDFNIEELEILQRLNLFIAYLDEAPLDNLYESLLCTSNHPKKWPKLVRMYLSLLSERRYIERWVCRWSLCDLSRIGEKLINNSTRRLILRDLNSCNSAYLIEQNLKGLRHDLKSCPKFKRIFTVERLLQKNSKSAFEYLNQSFKENCLILRFVIENKDSSQNLTYLKGYFTNFIKGMRRAPKFIGASLDSYIGYVIENDGDFYIDFTSILYIKDGMSSDDVAQNIKNYWDHLNKPSSPEQASNRDTKHIDNRFTIIQVPVLGQISNQSYSQVIIKGDVHIVKLVKKGLIDFYTVYEYFSDYKNADGKKRPENFLKGRLIKPRQKNKMERQDKTAEDILTTEVIQTNQLNDVVEQSFDENVSAINAIVDQVLDQPHKEDDTIKLVEIGIKD